MDRLSAIADCVDPCECVADVGCDHGLLSKMLLESGKVRRVIACDISAPSLKKAEKLARDFALNIETRCGDGLTVLKAAEAQSAVIAGMGGLEALHILCDERRIDGISRFVVSPHSEHAAFRRGLPDADLHIVSEKVIFDHGHDYFIMKLERGADVLSLDEQEFGRLIHEPTAEFFAYLDRKIRVIECKLAEFGEIQSLKAELTRLRRIRFTERSEE